MSLFSVFILILSICVYDRAHDDIEDVEEFDADEATPATNIRLAPYHTKP